MNKKIIEECNKLMEKYGHLPFDKGQPLMQEGWWSIGKKYGKTGPEVLQIYLDWKSQQTNK